MNHWTRLGAGIALVAASLLLPLAQESPAMAAPKVPACRSTALMLAGERDNGAAGTTYEALLIKNISSHACTLSGTPVTQFGNFTGSGGIVDFKGVGPAAANLTIAGRGKTIVVKPGAIANVTVGFATAGDYAPAQCHQATASRVRLIFKSGVTLIYTLFATHYSQHQVAVCTKLASTSTSGVVLGTSFH